MGDDALYVRWNGGGGIGDPLDRDPAQVLDDVSNQTISPEAALAMYGVVIENNLVNTPETERVRKGLRENRIMQKEGI